MEQGVIFHFIHKDELSFLSACIIMAHELNCCHPECTGFYTEGITPRTWTFVFQVAL